MATYTITVNERTKEGKGLVNYLKTLGVIEVPNEKTRKAIQEIREGKGKDKKGHSGNPRGKRHCMQYI